MATKSIRLSDGTNTLLPEAAQSASNYCQLADGTLICMGYKEVPFVTSDWSPWGSLYYSPNISFDNFVKPFISAPYVFLSSYGAEGLLGNIIGTTATNPGYAYLTKPTAGNGTVKLQYIAVGRWK